MPDLITTDINRRHDFVFLVDVRDGNPNGDPDAGNMPRVDPETMQGLVTDVAIKRKVRDYVDLAHGDGRFKVYVQHGQFLSEQRKRVFDQRSDGKTPTQSDGRKWMCEEFYDVRMFGAVMSMKEHNAGQVRGPMQLTFARSIDPIMSLDSTIVGPAQNNKDVNREENTEGQATNYGTMGRKSTVPYGLYRAHGFFNPHFAERTGVNSDDLELFWKALEMMWDLDRSATRGEMACRGLYVFTHDSKLGNAPAHRLFNLIETPKSDSAAPRSFTDYRVKRLADGQIENHPGVRLTTLVG